MGVALTFVTGTVSAAGSNSGIGHCIFSNETQQLIWNRIIEEDEVEEEDEGSSAKMGGFSFYPLT